VDGLLERPVNCEGSPSSYPRDIHPLGMRRLDDTLYGPTSSQESVGEAGRQTGKVAPVTFSRREKVA
jgi:hypothetical protein